MLGSNSYFFFSFAEDVFGLSVNNVSVFDLMLLVFLGFVMQKFALFASNRQIQFEGTEMQPHHS